MWNNLLIPKIVFLSTYDEKNNYVFAEKKQFRTLASPMHVWRFRHATVVEQNIEIGFSLIISIYKA